MDLHLFILAELAFTFDTSQKRIQWIMGLHIYRCALLTFSSQKLLHLLNGFSLVRKRNNGGKLRIWTLPTYPT